MRGYRAAGEVSQVPALVLHALHAQDHVQRLDAPSARIRAGLDVRLAQTAARIPLAGASAAARSSNP